MDAQRILESLTEDGLDVALSRDASRLEVRFNANGRAVSLTHDFPVELLRPPKFHLVGGHRLGKLAHVLSNGQGDGGEVCIGDVASSSVNRDRPDLVYRQTVREHVELLTRLVEDPPHNRREQLREFAAHWRMLCRTDSGSRELFVLWDGLQPDQLEVRPTRSKSGADLNKTHVAIARGLLHSQATKSVCASADCNRRPVIGLGVALPIDPLEPAPSNRGDAVSWYFRTRARLGVRAKKELARLEAKRKREYWVVLSGPLEEGRAFLAMHWSSSRKAGLPRSQAEVSENGWMLTPYAVRSLAHESLVPRGGGSLGLAEKSVLLVGCGSVGSELAHCLTSAGLGRLVISDPENFAEENLYRHTLSLRHIGLGKSAGVAQELAQKHPWAEISSQGHSLQDLRDADTLKDFDLVVVAIGAPTVERAFAEFCQDENVQVGTLNCWVEAYGLGGHAILALPGSRGCWHCAYVDPKTLRRGAASNLNFLAPNQISMRDPGGCGAQFLPYSGISASQTASMAADLAVRFLSGETTESSRVSWKGSATGAKRASLQTSYRYDHFEGSLKIEPLYDENCDICNW